MATHVDDVIWASEPEFEEIVQEMQRVLQLGTVEEYTFSFCELKMMQDPKTFAVAIICSAMSEKLPPARLSNERSQQIDDALNDVEKEQFQCMVVRWCGYAVVVRQRLDTPNRRYSRRARSPTSRTC